MPPPDAVFVRNAAREVAKAAKAYALEVGFVIQKKLDYDDMVSMLDNLIHRHVSQNPHDIEFVRLGRLFLEAKQEYILAVAAFRDDTAKQELSA